MDSNHQDQNQMSDEIVQLLTAFSYQDSYFSENGESSIWGSSINVSHSVVQMPHQGAQFVPGESSRTSLDESSLIADVNSSFSGSSYLPGNGTNIIESLGSNCGKIPGTLARDHFSAQQQTFQTGQSYPRSSGRQGNQLPNPTLSQKTMIPAHQTSITPPMDLKKPRLDMTPEEGLCAYSPRQSLPGPSRFFQKNLTQNQKHNQAPFFAPSPQRHQMQCLPPHQMPEEAQKQLAAITMQGSICARRLMYYMNQQRNRPSDNNISFWRKLVEEYYAPTAKRRWCLSGCNKGSQDYWNCTFCRSSVGKGFEVTYEFLPRVCQVYFESGVIEELLHVDSPVEQKLSSGLMMLWFNKAVQESIYKHFRVVHEGQLCIVFTQDLKIISWDFCIQSLEEFIPRSLVAAQVNELVEDTAKCQSIVKLWGTERDPAQELATNCNRIMAAGQNLATNLELPINEAGFSKQFIRYLQMSEIFDCMKGLIADSKTNNFSPIETLKRYRQEAANAKLKKPQEGRAQMQQTPRADDNIQVANLMAQIPIAREQAMNSPNYHPNPLSEEHRKTSDLHQSFNNKPLSYSVPYQHSDSSAKSSSGPSSTVQCPTIGCQINDLLAKMHTKVNTGSSSLNTRGSKRRLVCDPNINPQVMEFAERRKVGTEEKEANTSYILGDMVDKGKGFNYSSNSNSSAWIFADNCLMKQGSDDDTTSAACHHQFKEE